MYGLRRKMIVNWRRFKHSEPGRRFQERYDRARQSRETGESPNWVRPLNLFGGAALMVAGLAFLPTPGPSYIIIVLGLWMMSGQWLPLARLFDWLEPKWRSAPGWAKVVGAVVLIGALVYVVFG